MILQRVLKWPGLLTAFWLGVLSPSGGRPQLLCVQLNNGDDIKQSLPINHSGAMRLSFPHSIYGSQVEEVFALRPDGFLLTQLRYSEARLVDFYGYEKAQHDNGAWIVSPPPTLLPSLSLRTSADTALSLQFDRSNAKPLFVQATGALRLTVTSCKSSVHG